jgi:hypothetical protein
LRTTHTYHKKTSMVFARRRKFSSRHTARLAAQAVPCSKKRACWRSRKSTTLDQELCSFHTKVRSTLFTCLLVSSITWQRSRHLQPKALLTCATGAATRGEAILTDNIIVARGVVPLPKSVTNSRIEENLKVIKLDSSDLDALNKIHQTKGVTRFVYPAFGVSPVGSCRRSAC